VQNSSVNWHAIEYLLQHKVSDSDPAVHVLSPAHLLNGSGPNSSLQQRGRHSRSPSFVEFQEICCLWDIERGIASPDHRNHQHKEMRVCLANGTWLSSPAQSCRLQTLQVNSSRNANQGLGLLNASSILPQGPLVAGMPIAHPICEPCPRHLGASTLRSAHIGDEKICRGQERMEAGLSDNDDGMLHARGAPCHSALTC
jgi:hypothetical protein